jgi:methionyl-tRNA synthetase
LVATYGNLAHRVLTFTNRNLGGVVPSGEGLDDQTRQLITKAETAVNTVGEFLSQCRFKDGVKAAMSLAQEANRYIDEKAPWKTFKQDKVAASMAVYGVMAVLSALKTIFYPYLPFSSQKLHSLLGFDGTIESGNWEFQLPVAGRKLPPPQALFTKLDDSIVAEEMGKMGTPK